MLGALNEKGADESAPFLLPVVFMGPRDKSEDDGGLCWLCG